MEDVAPKLLKSIEEEFGILIDENRVISDVYKKLRDGSATYEDANKFSIEVGRALSKAFKNNLSSDVLPDGKMYYNIAQRIINPTMKNNYDLIADVTNQVQTSLNKSAKIGIKAIKPELNQDRILGIVNKVSDAENYDDVAWVLDEPIVNFSQSIVDDSIKANSEFQYKAGMTPKIVRKLAGGCCDWCREFAGIYTYPKVPKDVYRRHQRCRCTVEYDPGTGKRQNVHTKKWHMQEEYDKIETRKGIGLAQELNSEKIEYRKHVGENNLSYAESRALTNYVSSDSYIINDKLRRDAELTDAEKQFCADLDNALKKMPTYRGNLSRSLYFYSQEDIMDFVDLLQEQGIVSFKEYISTTKGTELYNPEGQVQLYIQNSRKGHDIGSFNQQELEVLYERDTRFRVKKKQNVENVWYILLEED